MLNMGNKGVDSPPMSSALTSAPVPYANRVLCNGRVTLSYHAATFIDAELTFSAFGTSAPDLWQPKPLVVSKAGAIRVRCGAQDLKALRSAYAGLALEPLLNTVRGERRGSTASATTGSALLVLPDYANLFHQMGSVVAAYAALTDARRADARDDLAVYMLNNASLVPTSAFWSPGLSARRPVLLGGSQSAAAAPRRFGRVVVAQPPTEIWYWNVWKEDRTDRRALLTPMVRQLCAALMPAAGRVISGGLVLLAQRGTDRVILNARELEIELRADLPAHNRSQRFPWLVGWALPSARAPTAEVRLLDLGKLSTRQQLATIRGTSVLVGAHGAALLWNLFLPPGAPLVELLNLANRNRYYANQCAWQHRPYFSWQNADAAAEAAARDGDGRAIEGAPFRHDMLVDVSAVASLVRDAMRRWEAG